MKHFVAQVAQRILRGFRTRRSARLLGIALGVFVIALMVPAVRAAGIGDWVANIGSSFLLFVVSQLGKLTSVLFDVLIQVAQFNDFVNNPFVEKGWVVVRDVANMLFIIVLLVIAFGTLFRIERYRYTALLRRLIIMAVLINFSRTITGFFIDFMQVIMMTFVNAFAETAASNLANALGLPEIVALDPNKIPADITAASVFGTLLLGLILITVIAVVVVVYILMFISRIVALWLLTILSPIAYLFSTFPGTQSWSSKWWHYFWQYAMLGPVVSFFLWLILSVTVSTSPASLISESIETGGTVLEQGPQFAAGGSAIAAGISRISAPGNLLGFILSVVLLVVALNISSSFSVAGANLARRAASNVQRQGIRAGLSPLRAARRVGQGVGRRVRGVAGRQVERAGGGLSGALARSRFPILNDFAARQNARIQARQKERKEGASAWVSSINDMRVLQRMANGTARTAGAKARQEAARKRAPAVINDPTEFQAQVRNMELEDFRKLPASQIHDIAERLGPGAAFHTIAPEKAEWLIRGASLNKKEAAGYAGAGVGGNFRWDRTRGVPLDPNGLAPGERDPRTGATFVMPVPDATHIPTRRAPAPGAPNPKYNPNDYLSDIDETRLRATQEAIQKSFQGDTAAFFKSAEFTNNRQNYLTQREFDQTLSQQRMRERREQRGQFRLEQVTGVNKTLRNAETGEQGAVRLAVGPDVWSALKLGSGAGARLTGEEKSQAADTITQRVRSQRMDEEAERRYQERREQDARSGSIHSPEDAARHKEQITANLQGDAAFQRKLDEEADKLRNAIVGGASLQLVNKGRVGRSAQQVLRHESMHDAIESIPEEDKEALWQQVAPERQQEIEQHVRQNWHGGQQMSRQELIDEYLTEAAASYGRSEQIGPLRFSDKERDIALQLKSRGVKFREPQEAEPATEPTEGAARGAAVSVSELDQRGTRPQTVAPPSGERGVTAQPATRAVEKRTYDEAPSPIIQTNVIQNTTVRSVARDFSQHVGNTPNRLPQKADILYHLQRLEDTLVDVAREQSIDERELGTLHEQIERLREDTQHANETPDQRRVLQQNLQNFLRRLVRHNQFADGGSEEEESDDEGGIV